LDIYNFEYNPRILVADSAKSITKGFKRVFDLKFRIDCWAHVDRNIDKNMKKHINKQGVPIVPIGANRRRERLFLEQA
jgi:hypothetical protein